VKSNAPSNPLLNPLLLLLPSLIGTAFQIHQGLIVPLMYSQIIIQIVSLKRFTQLAGYFQLLSSGKRIELSRDIDDVAIAIFKKGINRGGLVI
jgi:hypothetical protein